MTYSGTRSTIYSIAAIMLLADLCHAQYDRDRAGQYIVDWVQTDLDGDLRKRPDHVNNSQSAFNKSTFVPQAFPKADRNYHWYDRFGSHLGDNLTGNRVKEVDCTNFVSQAMIESGISFASLKAQAPDLTFGVGDTLIRVSELAAVLPSIATPFPFTLTAQSQQFPSVMQKGDVVQWGEGHMSIAGTTARISYHSPDTFNASSSDMYELFRGGAREHCQRNARRGTDCAFSNFSKSGIVWHITGTNIQASLERTSPVIIVRDSRGNIIQNNGTTSPGRVLITVSDAGSGVNYFEVIQGAPVSDSLEEMIADGATYIYDDYTFRGTSHVYEVDLNQPGITEGKPIFVKAFDKAGNPALTIFTLKTLPFVKLATVAGKLLVDNSVSKADVFSAVANPQISVTFDDVQSDIDIDTVKLFIDGSAVEWNLGGYGSLTVFHNPAAKLADGAHTLRMVAKDLAGNEIDNTASFRIVTTPPMLEITNEYGQSMPHGSLSQSASITSIAKHNPAPVRSLEFFVGNAPGPVVDFTPGNLDIIDRDRQFASNSWHYVRACDEGLNCVYSLFGVFSPDTDPSVPGGNRRQPPVPPGPPPPCPGCTQRPNVQPLPPPDDPNNPPPPPWPPLPPGPPSQPVCRGEDCLKKQPAPEPSWEPKPKRPRYCERSPGSCRVPIAFPHDPNAKYGPAGSVVPGQLMTYTIEFENEGEGLALETFVRDTLDPSLDATSFVLRDMRRVNYLTKTETPANFPWSYDARTRTITVLTGDADFRQGGRFIVETRLKADTAPGTMITNQAVVHFPNSLEVTPTNVIVSAVPLPTQLAYEGASSTAFLAPTRFAARLTAAGRPLVQQPVEFLLAGSSWTVTTDASGLAAISTAIAVLPGAYGLQVRYLGDGLLYSARETLVDYAIGKKPVRLEAPFASARSSERVRFAVSLVDDAGRPLNAQLLEPKTIHLELLQGGGVVAPLGSALLSGASVAFEIALPRPLQISWSVRARFDGDSRYAAAISTGILQLIDQTPPAISIVSPAGGRTYSSSQFIPIGFSAQDNEDPAPVASAVLVSSGGQSMPVSDGNAIAASLLDPGRWSLVVQATDWAGNQAAARGAAFEVLAVSDVLAPRTSLSVGRPQAGTDPVFVTSATAIDLTAIDDMSTVSDGIGLGVAKTFFAIDSNSFAAYTEAFRLVAPGTHTIQYFSVDVLGNAEAPRSAQVAVDGLPARTTVAFGEPKFAGARLFLSSSTLIQFASADDLAVAGDGRGVGTAQTMLSIDSAAFAAVASRVSLSTEGAHVLAWFSRDLVDNAELVASTSVAVDLTPPVTRLGISTPMVSQATGTVVGPATVLSLFAQDPVSGGVASGLRDTFLAVSTSVFTLAPATFTLNGIDGARVVSFYSRDNIFNAERATNATVLLDATPPATTLAPSGTFFTAGGRDYALGTFTYALTALDPTVNAVASGAAETLFRVDASSFARYISALSLAEGVRRVDFQSADNVGNRGLLKSATVFVDATPPVTVLSIGAPQFQLPNALLVSSRTPFAVAAFDPIVNGVASGFKDASFRVSDNLPGTSAFSAFAAPFTMAGADANKVIEYFSRDNVLNAEVLRSSTVLLDSTPPEIALLSPASCGAGICRVLKGKFPVLGTARDPHFANYQLEFAPGQDATTGYALISSGTLAVSSGTLGTWDASALSGWLTLRLSASDLVQNVSVLALNIFVGDPGQILVLGNHEIFDMPEGVAAGADGKIYVADRNNDRIAVFSSTGAFLTSLGGQKGDDDDDDDDDEDHKQSTTTLRLNKPSGVAVDAAGNVYVADANRDRVLKLSAAGQVLLTLGKFQHPAGVAVDAASNIYVADTGNRRVQVFSSTGAFSFQFNLPPIPARLEDDDDGDEDDDEGRIQLGKPSGIAVDAAGNIYVADSKGGRGLKFGATGNLLLTIPIPGDKPGRLGQPYGVAVSTGGDCLLVSDRRTSRILKFDFLGNSNLAFGEKGKIKGDDAPTPSAIVFKKPMGLALDAQGSLFVADRNNNRIQKLALPTGQAPLVVPPPKPEDDHIARGVADTEDGGKIERRDRAAVDIPAGALAADLKITVSTPAFSAVDDLNRRRAAEDAKLKTASPPVEYGPEGTKFKGSVTLTLPFSPELIALQKIDAKDLKVRYWNREKSLWEDLESSVDPKTRTVKAKTSHFSLYQVFSGTVSAAAIAPLAADATFTFHDAYAFPNPVRGAGAVTIRMQTGLADSVEVRIYDVSGRKIHSSSNFSLNPSLDDGNGKGEQYTYDHVWDVSGVGSGVYQFVITAKKAGHSDIHKTGRAGVVK